MVFGTSVENIILRFKQYTFPPYLAICRNGADHEMSASMTRYHNSSFRNIMSDDKIDDDWEVDLEHLKFQRQILKGMRIY